MRFDVRPGLILFSDDRPGDRATLFGGDPGAGRAHLPDASSFDDAVPWYTWAFAREGAVVEGEVYVFATADREVVGIAAGDAICISPLRAAVDRGEGGVPARVLGLTRVEE